MHRPTLGAFPVARRDTICKFCFLTIPHRVSELPGGRFLAVHATDVNPAVRRPGKVPPIRNRGIFPDAFVTAAYRSRDTLRSRLLEEQIFMASKIVGLGSTIPKHHQKSPRIRLTLWKWSQTLAKFFYRNVASKRDLDLRDRSRRIPLHHCFRRD